MKEETIEHLKSSLEFAKQYDEDFDSVSWGYEQGCLISQNDAVDIVALVEQNEKMKSVLYKITERHTKNGRKFWFDRAGLTINEKGE